MMVMLSLRISAHIYAAQKIAMLMTLAYFLFKKKIVLINFNAQCFVTLQELILKKE